VSEFSKLVDEFEALMEKSMDLQGNDLRANRREQAKVERLIASLAETGMHSYDNTFTDCRDIGHLWDERFSNWEANELTRLCICDRCGCERYETMSRVGAVIGRRYVYPENYLLEQDEMKELGGREKRFWRAVNIQRVISSP
jgi:hypothetical protein